ncbi:interferon-induced, double-stranded RNA-activated protein kinase-like isoform X2 [Pseudochaenichthys georgianus]|uniref:interferon-induced, double-stranded RNA-activated protein kinase-like isoform X2 n=1 Tax=Pseudochaenichthys georgianus TaxID=52239 RepID=UPI0039C0B739
MPCSRIICRHSTVGRSRFFTRAVVNGQCFPIGGGNNAKEAKRNAARNALEGLREKENPKPVTAAKVPQKTATKVLAVLNENVPKARADMKAGQSTRQDPHDAPQCSSFVVGDKERPAVPGKSMKDAKEEAAETSSGNDDVAEARPPTAMDTRDAKSKSVPMTDFINSSSPTEDEEQDPVVKPKTRLETTDPSCKSENQEVNTGNCPNDNTSTKSEMSRFTSDFDCMEKIGRGSYGQVFKAREKLTGKYRAIKIVRCGSGKIEEALQEVETLSKLEHPNIVRYLISWLEDSGYSPDQSGSSTQNRYLYILTELCVKSLRVWIDENNEKKSLLDPKRREEALTKFQQTVRGVEYIHSKTLIHRDLKPENIMIGQDGQVKIVDFGMVTLDNDPENLRERLMGKGTTSYMAPEQMRQKTYDRKVDIFPLGLIYFELLWKMSTCCERAMGWPDLRVQKCPKEFQHNSHQEYLIIKLMLCEKPEQRPEASQIHADLKKISDSFHIKESRGNWSV